MRVFGIEAVYMLAKTDLQYAHLVGQFFVPYWDDEHATQYEEYLAAFLNEHGWHPEVIKALFGVITQAFAWRCLWMIHTATTPLISHSANTYNRTHANTPVSNRWWWNVLKPNQCCL
ncbi:hypothetical protein JCM19238_3656 [Vibrio ponticus]|nr:hypothetical protein JCM19238_3656 [Vibrio ponticus]